MVYISVPLYMVVSVNFFSPDNGVTVTAFLRF